MDYALATADYAVMAAFFVVLLAIGVFYAGRMHDLRDFFSGGRSVPWWLAGVSLYMTTFSAFTFVSYSALAYTYGAVAVSIWWFAVPGCLASAWFLAARWRRAATTSPVEYIETRFSPALRQCFSWFGIPLIVFDDALKLFVIGTLISVSTGIDSANGVVWAIIASGTIMVVYTLLGGLWAVLITDFIQFVVMGTAVLILAPLAWRRAGGFTNILEAAPDGYASITTSVYTWPWLLSFSVILALTYATKWPYVQRYYAARSDSEARKVGYLVAVLTVAAPPLLFFPAFAARAFLPDVVDANEVYAIVCRELLPVGMMGMLLAAMFSATMSMLSSDYNALASVITNDIIKRLFVREASDRVLVIIARVVTLAVGLAAMVLAIMFAQAEQLEDLVQYMARLFSGLLPPVAIPMMAGLLSRRVTNGGALMGFALGASCGAVAYFMSYGEGMEQWRTVPSLTWGTVVPTCAGLAIGSIFFRHSAEKQRTVDAFLEGLHSRGEAAPSRSDGTIAARIIGLTTAGVGGVLAFSVMATEGFVAGVISIGVGLVLCLGGGACVALSYRSRKGEV